jgi:hypothetical protein
MGIAIASMEIKKLKPEFHEGSNMLHEFLLSNEKEILEMTEGKTRDLAGVGPTSEQLKLGLPIFYRQLVNVLRTEQNIRSRPTMDKVGMAKAARESNEILECHPKKSSIWAL